MFLSTGILSQSRGDQFDFDYHSFGIGEQCVSFAWNYVRQSCTPVKFQLQGFDPDDVRASRLNSPKLALNSTSSAFSLIRKLARAENLYYKIIGIDENEAICDTNNLMTDYFNYSKTLETGIAYKNNGSTCLIVGHIAGGREGG